MSTNMDDALQTFIVESRELLQTMEASLLEIGQGGDDTENINAIFRAAHTIKGSAGLFSLDPIVAFTHVAESVLDRVRAQRIAMDPALARLFLDVCDQMGALVERVASGLEVNGELQARSDELARQLSHHLEGTAVFPVAGDWPDGAPAQVAPPRLRPRLRDERPLAHLLAWWS